MYCKDGKYIQDNNHHYRVDLIIEDADHTVHTERRTYDIYAANNESADALAWACIRQDQQALFENGAIGANTCHFNGVIPGDPYRQ
jgi:hypothetical protein